MAQELDDGEFWLPPEFLNDEDILMDFIPGKSNYGNPAGVFKKGSSGFHSDLSSPVESVNGSTETESDEEDYLNGLARKLTNTTVQEDFWRSDSKVMAGSPQSTLCGCKHGSSRGSPNCPSPPAMAAPVNRNDASWELLYAAAGEVARMRMAEEAASRYYQQLQVAQFQQLKKQQMVKQQQQQQQYLQMIEQSRRRNEGLNPGRVSGLSSWPTPQQAHQPRQPGSGFRAVFLGNGATKRESTGTGVFLPRQVGAPAEPIKKRGCSTVLLPDRVVQALNLNLEAMEVESKLHSRCTDAETVYRNSVPVGHQRRNNLRQPSAPVMTELRLPQEWTY